MRLKSVSGAKEQRYKRTFWTTFSDSLSSAEVASSRSRMRGLRIKARAMATRSIKQDVSVCGRSGTTKD